MKQGGFIIFAGLALAFFKVSAQPAPPLIPEPTADAIARAIEAERQRRAAELNNPITQIGIQRAQQIQIALQDVNLKSQEYRITIENVLEAVQKANSPKMRKFLSANHQHRLRVWCLYRTKAGRAVG